MDLVIKKTLNFLDKNKIKYSLMEHDAFFTVDDVKNSGLVFEGNGVKTLFLRDGKGRNFYLVAIRDDKKVDLKQLSLKVEEKRLSFASEKNMNELIPEIKPGSVSPLALIFNNKEGIKLIIDNDLWRSEKISMHPNKNTATVILNKKNFRKLFEILGNFIIYEI